MPDKKTTDEILRTPECVECFENINTHANYVFGMFEVKSDEMIKGQVEKHDKFLEKANTRENIKLASNSITLAVFAIMIYNIYSKQDELEKTINDLSNKKADKIENVSKNEFELIIQQGDEYNKNMFVRKSEITADTFSYPMNKRRLFTGTTRSAAIKPKDNFIKDYEKEVKNQQ